MLKKNWMYFNAILFSKTKQYEQIKFEKQKNCENFI